MRGKRILLLALLSMALLVATSLVCHADPFQLGMSAQAHIAKKEYPQAVALLKKAIAEEPMNSWLRGMLANAYYQTKRFSEAKREYQVVLQMEPNNDLARFMVSVVEPLAGLEKEPARERAPQKELKAYQIEQRYGDTVAFIVIYNKKGKPFKLGSGFVITEDGLLVTNHHVVAGATSLKAKFTNGKVFAGDYVVSYSEKYDLAVVKLKAKDKLPAVSLGDSTKILLGEQAVAIGNPKGMEHTISDGLISAWRDLGRGFKFIQISVPISHGSSGGPLFNLRGEVVGVTQGGLVEGQNLNFAVPINMVKELLKKPGKIAFSQVKELKKKAKGKKPPKKAKTSTELTKEKDTVRCTNEKVGFMFLLPDDAWSLEEETEKGKFMVQVTSNELLVQVMAIAVKKMGEPKVMANEYFNALKEKGFTVVKEFVPQEPGKGPASPAILDKEMERGKKVRTRMLLFFKDRVVYIFSVWHDFAQEKELLEKTDYILKSFKS